MPRDGSSGVEGTFQTSTRPSLSSNRQMSVNVPPESTPTRQRDIIPSSIAPHARTPSLTRHYQTVGLYNFVVAHRTLPDDLVYGIAEAVFANPDEMMQIHNTAADTVPTNFARNTILPFHDGAARWYHNKSTSGVMHGD